MESLGALYDWLDENNILDMVLNDHGMNVVFELCSLFVNYPQIETNTEIYDDFLVGN